MKKQQLIVIVVCIYLNTLAFSPNVFAADSPTPSPSSVPSPTVSPVPSTSPAPVASTPTPTIPIPTVTPLPVKRIITPSPHPSVTPTPTVRPTATPTPNPKNIAAVILTPTPSPPPHSNSFIAFPQKLLSYFAPKNPYTSASLPFKTTLELLAVGSALLISGLVVLQWKEGGTLKKDIKQIGVALRRRSWLL